MTHCAYVIHLLLSSSSSSFYRGHIGVTCTADLRDPTNILSAGKFNLLPQRVFTVGRLDKDSSGGYRCNLLYGIDVLQQGGDRAYMDTMCADDAPALRDDVLIYDFIWWWCCW